MSLQEAQNKAQYFYNYAATLPEGPQKQEALNLAHAWHQEAQRLNQPYPNQQYQQPVPVRKGPPTAVIVALIVIPALLAVAGIAVSVGAVGKALGSSGKETSSQEYNTDPNNLPDVQVPDISTDPLPEETTPPSDPTTPPTPKMGVEEAWKAGMNSKPVPDGVNQPQPSTFLSNYASPQDWMSQTPTTADVKVVVTNDPTYNCAMSTGNWSTAGCYNPAYGKTLFLWWNADSTDEVKEFIIAHETSHYYQWYYNFDTMNSAVQAGFAENKDFAYIVETDATCRVLSWGGYSKQVSDESSSPCNIDGWYEGWLTDQVKALGVTIIDY